MKNLSIQEIKTEHQVLQNSIEFKRTPQHPSHKKGVGGVCGEMRCMITHTAGVGSHPHPVEEERGSV